MRIIRATGSARGQLCKLQRRGQCVSCCGQFCFDHDCLDVAQSGVGKTQAATNLAGFGYRYHFEGCEDYDGSFRLTRGCDGGMTSAIEATRFEFFGQFSICHIVDSRIQRILLQNGDTGLLYFKATEPTAIEEVYEERIFRANSSARPIHRLKLFEGCPYQARYLLRKVGTIGSAAFSADVQFTVKSL
jgi:hypothetical protein